MGIHVYAVVTVSGYVVEIWATKGGAERAIEKAKGFGDNSHYQVVEFELFGDLVLFQPFEGGMPSFWLETQEREAIRIAADCGNPNMVKTLCVKGCDHD